MRVAGQRHPAGDFEQALNGIDLLRATLVGITAGVSAAFLMNQFQALVSSFQKDEDSGSDGGEESKPSTVKAADAVSEKVSGEPVPRKMQRVAGAAVHYGFGAFLGGLYGAIGTARPRVRTGFGTAYAASVALVADEAMVPALGLSPPPQESPASTHAYSLISHLVFGIALEGSRRILEGALVSSIPRRGDADQAGKNAIWLISREGVSA